MGNRLLAVASAVLTWCATSETRAERTVYASVDGSPGYLLRSDAPIPARPLAEVLAGFRGPLTERTVVQLLLSRPGTPTEYRALGADCRFTIQDVQGSMGASLVIRGLRQGNRILTSVVADSVEEIVKGRISCRPGIAIAAAELRVAAQPEMPALERLRFALAGNVARRPGLQPLAINVDSGEVRCFAVRNSRHVEFENLHFRDCWLTAIYIADSSDIAVRGNFIEGSTAAVYAVSLTRRIEEVRGFSIENNRWLQDASAYDGGRCREIGGPLDCPGRMWSTIPWAVSHDTRNAHMNGALFAGVDIAGDVTVRANLVSNAYNGVRLQASGACADTGWWCTRRINRDVRILGNEFVFVRDNPVEPEHRAEEWTVSGNSFRNSHAWISLDGVSGGPVFVWGNIGWHDAAPARRCTDGEPWPRLERVDFVNGGHRPLQWQPTDFNPACTVSVFGTIVKEGSGWRALDKDVYVFHNSWRVRTPVVRGGAAGRIHYWNNATLVNACGFGPDPLCRIWTSAQDGDCTTGFVDLLADDGRSIFLKCVDGRQAADVGRYDFRYNLVSVPLPTDFLRPAGRREGLVVGDPRFLDVARSDFRLGAGSPALGAGCIVERSTRPWQALVCRPPRPGEPRPDIGAYTGGALYGGP